MLNNRLDFKRFMQDYPPRTESFNSDSRDGTIKGTAENCAFIAVHDVGLNEKLLRGNTNGSPGVGIFQLAHFLTKQGAEPVELPIRKAFGRNTLTGEIAVRQVSLLNDFIKLYNKGKYVLMTPNHAFSVIDGQPHNITDWNAQIICAYKVPERRFLQ